MRKVMKIVIFGCFTSSTNRICMQAAYVCDVTFFLTSQDTKKYFFQILNSPVVGRGPSHPVPKEAAVIWRRVLLRLATAVPRTPTRMPGWLSHFEGWSVKDGQGVAWQDLHPVVIRLHRVSPASWRDSGTIFREYSCLLQSSLLVQRFVQLRTTAVKAEKLSPWPHLPCFVFFSRAMYRLISCSSVAVWALDEGHS